MKRLLVAAGIACSMAAVTAHAQSSVTLYGVVDTGLLYQGDPVTGSGSKLSVSGGGEASSIFGFTGKEDLGGGYSAVFKIEGSYSSATGVSTLTGLFGRESRVGINTPYGEVDAGLQYTPLYRQGIIAGDAFMQDLVGYIGTLFASDPRANNSIVYTSKNYYGFMTSLMYSLGGVTGNFQASRIYSGSLSYIRGPIRLNVAYWNSNDATGKINSNSVLLSGNYDFGPVNVFSEVQRNRSDNPLQPGAGSKFQTDDNAYSLGIRVPLGIHLAVAQASYLTDARPGAQNDGHVLFLSAGLFYYLSKRTNLYASAGHTFNHGSVAFSTADNTSALYGQTSVSVGLRHAF